MACDFLERGKLRYVINKHCGHGREFPTTHTHTHACTGTCKHDTAHSSLVSPDMHNIIVSQCIGNYNEGVCRIWVK